MNLIDKARDLAKEAHESIGQKRKYTGDPYYYHVWEVAGIVKEVTDNQNVIAAAFLHDTPEDVLPINPKYNFLWIKNEFGYEVFHLVDQLTDQFTKEQYPHLNRAQRKLRERERWIHHEPDSMTVKLADLLSNTKDILQNDRDFARVYVREKALLLPYLKKGNSVLFERAERQVAEAMKELGL